MDNEVKNLREILTGLKEEVVTEQDKIDSHINTVKVLGDKMDVLNNFELELRDLINKYSLENDSETPDFILARYLVSCLGNFNNAIYTREAFTDDK